MGVREARTRPSPQNEREAAVIRVFPPSTLAHPWLETFPVLLWTVVFALALYDLFLVVLWLTSLLGTQPWSWGPISG